MKPALIILALGAAFWIYAAEKLADEMKMRETIVLTLESVGHSNIQVFRSKENCQTYNSVFKNRVVTGKICLTKE